MPDDLNTPLKVSHCYLEQKTLSFSAQYWLVSGRIWAWFSKAESPPPQ